MRKAALLSARSALIAGPIVLAFFAGGFNDGPRNVGLLVAGVVLAVLVAVTPTAEAVPGHRAARVALGAAAAYAAWIGLSALWAPVRDYAGDDAERALLYAVALAAAAIAFRDRSAARLLEATAAAGAVVVVGYGLAGRLLPGIVAEHPQLSAAGRLDQPLTYWNAVGAVAAIGIVLCARLAGNPGRPRVVRAAAASAAVPLGMGCYLTFSRGAVAALAAGLLTLAVLAPTRAQLRATALAVAGGACGAAAAGVAPAVRSLSGSLSTREREGAIVAVVMLALMAAAGLAGSRALPAGRLSLPRGSAWVVAALILALLVVPVAAAGGRQQAPPATGASNARFASVGSNRYAYWRVAIDAGVQHPLIGVGASGFRTEWLKHRHIDESVRDAHSLEVETFGELGLVGVALLATLLGAVALSARAAYRADAALAAGPAAVLALWAFHSAIDWDWEMPALTLMAVVFAGTLLGHAGAAVTAPRRFAEPRG